MTTGHLWEYDHPYYCAEGNYFKAGQHAHFESWQEFASDTDFASGDRDMNLLIRWDWHAPGELVLHFVLQRKALLCSVGIAVIEDDEPAIREFLQQCGKTIAAIWEPVGLTSTSASSVH